MDLPMTILVGVHDTRQLASSKVGHRSAGPRGTGWISPPKEKGWEKRLRTFARSGFEHLLCDWNLFLLHLLVGGLDSKAFLNVHYYWECHHPNWRTHIFQRSRYTTNQILVRKSLFDMLHVKNVWNINIWISHPRHRETEAYLDPELSHKKKREWTTKNSPAFGWIQWPILDNSRVDYFYKPAIFLRLLFQCFSQNWMDPGPVSVDHSGFWICPILNLNTLW